ncbi:hypothetical protein [Streptomyces sp. NPDC095613]|uniref:hypothetical protein n=1 Tax=Streptomyces sp. NPDC095613 TaxID=3155540 RepID=UPI00332A2474
MDVANEYRADAAKTGSVVPDQLLLVLVEPVPGASQVLLRSVSGGGHRGFGLRPVAAVEWPGLVEPGAERSGLLVHGPPLDGAQAEFLHRGAGDRGEQQGQVLGAAVDEAGRPGVAECGDDVAVCPALTGEELHRGRDLQVVVRPAFAFQVPHPGAVPVV